MAARSLTIKKEKGNFVTSVVEIIDTLKIWLGDVSNGTYVLTLSRYTKPRSSEQNALMWLWFQAIADEWTEASGRLFTRQNVHDAYCELFLPIETPKGVIAGSTSALNTEQFSEFLDKVQADAASEYGITLPDPDDYNFALWVKQHGGSTYFD